MENSKKTLQKVVGIIFIAAIAAFLLFAVNQLQLNDKSKIIIKDNNEVVDSFSAKFKDTYSSFENIKTLKLDTELRKTLEDKIAETNTQIDDTKALLKEGINSPSSNNYKFAISRLDPSYKDILKETSSLLDLKVCFKTKYEAFTAQLSTINATQDNIASAQSLADSKVFLTEIREAYSTLANNIEDIPTCLDSTELFSDLKTNLQDIVTQDKKSIETYQTGYLDPLITIYTSEDTGKINEFIEANPDVTLQLKMPNLFDDSVDLSIVDKVIESEVDFLKAKI